MSLSERFKNLAASGAKKLGLDSLVSRFLLGRGGALAGQVAVLFCVGLYMGSESTGIYFTFLSVAAFQAVFEMGLGVVVTQHAARLRAKLVKFSIDDEAYTPIDPHEDLDKLYGFVTFCSAAVATIALCAFLLIGEVVLPSLFSGVLVPWRSPWVFTAFAVAGMLIVNLQMAYFEGAGLMRRALEVRVVMSIAGPCLAIVMVIQGMGLYSIAAGFLMQICLFCIWWIFSRSHQFGVVARKSGRAALIYWARRLYPMQWRMAISWVAGYIVYQSAVPVTLYFEGAEAAGEIGFLVAISNALVALLSGWSSTKVPQFCSLVDQQRFSEAKRVHFSALARSLRVFFLAAVALTTLFLYFHNTEHLNSITLMHVSCFLATAGCTIASVAQGMVLRAFLTEPFLVTSLLYGLAVLVLLPVTTSAHGLDGLCIVLFGGAVFNLVMTSVVFGTRRELREA